MKGKKPKQIVELSKDTYHLKPTSSTFHGRDIFAPIAAQLSLGLSPKKLGNPVEDFVRLHWPEVTTKERSIQGEVIYVDGFGNLITNIQEDTLAPFPRNKLSTNIGQLQIHGLSASYSAVREGDVVAVMNSWRFLEIAVRNGSAANQTGNSVGAPVEVTLSDGK
jgi:S-adenosylmethionine hydrolase